MPLDIWGEVVRINVCQSSIDLQLNPSDSQSCAIYSALKKEFPQKVIHVLIDRIEIGERKYETLPCVYGWQMLNIHTTGKAKPMTLLFDNELMSVQIETEAI